MYCDVKWISSFFFVCPASSWWCDAQLCSLWICTGGVRPQSDRRGQYSLHPPCTCPGPAGAASTSVRHQHPAEELCHLSGCRNRWEIYLFFNIMTSVKKMDELGQEKLKRVSNQMLFFFFLMVQFVTCTMKSCQSLRPASLWPSTDLTATPSLSVSISCKIFNEAQVWL